MGLNRFQCISFQQSDKQRLGVLADRVNQAYGNVISQTDIDLAINACKGSVRSLYRLLTLALVKLNIKV